MRVLRYLGGRLIGTADASLHKANRNVFRPMKHVREIWPLEFNAFCLSCEIPDASDRPTPYFPPPFWESAVSYLPLFASDEGDNMCESIQRAWDDNKTKKSVSQPVNYPATQPVSSHPLCSQVSSTYFVPRVQNPSKICYFLCNFSATLLSDKRYFYSSFYFFQ